MAIEVRSPLVQLYQQAQLMVSLAMLPVSWSAEQSRPSNGASVSTPKQLRLQLEERVENVHDKACT